MKSPAVIQIVSRLFFVSAIFFAGCSAPVATGPVLDVQYAQSINAGRTAFDEGFMPQAAVLYQRALNRAEVMDNPQYIGDAGYNLAAALSRTGNPADLTRARTVLKESIHATTRAGGDLGGVLLLEAKIARMQGDRASALALADQVLAHSPSPGDQIWAHILKGDLAADVNDAAAARAELNQTDRDPSGASPALRAARAGLSGRVALMSNDPARAAIDFDQQADLLQQAAMFREMASARARAGQAFLSARRPAEGAGRLYRAARSAAAQQDETTAREWSTLALKAAKEANEKALIERIETFISQFEASTRPSVPLH